MHQQHILWHCRLLKFTTKSLDDNQCWGGNCAQTRIFWWRCDVLLNPANFKWIDHHGATANLPWSGRCTYTDVQEVSRDVVLSSHSIGNLIQTGSHHDIKMRHATLLRPLLELSLWKERQNLYHRRKPQVKASNETSSTHYSSVAVWGGCFVLLCWPAALVVKQGMVARNWKWNEQIQRLDHVGRSEQLSGYMSSKYLHMSPVSIGTEMRRLKDEYRFPKHPTFQKNPGEEFV